ncbi:MAG TPA: phosphatase PAP2 family protein [Gemmatimonadaceae bacterium]|nr:phosphatase PAP2 family protein [Gemmatimonadaceae bacterium]
MFSKSFRVALVLLILNVSAQAQVQDTIFHKTPLLTGKDALLFAAYTLGTVLVAPIDMKIANRLQYQGTQENQFLGRAATGFRLLGDPGSVVTAAGVYLIGRADGQRRVQALGLHTVESILLASSLGTGIKLLAGRQRPLYDIRNPYNFQLWRGFASDQYRSFPSGHTIAAFAFASTVTRETQFWWPHAGWYVGTVFYTGAGLVGISRMYNNMHWASDVMGGAAIGTIVGLKVVKYTHSHPGNHIDSKLIKGKRQSQIQLNPVLFSIQF